MSVLKVFFHVLLYKEEILECSGEKQNVVNAIAILKVILHNVINLIVHNMHICLLIETKHQLSNLLGLPLDKRSFLK